MLGGGAAGLPQLLPGPGQPLTKTPESKDPEIPARYFPAGGRASPALVAMQEPILNLPYTQDFRATNDIT